VGADVVVVEGVEPDEGAGSLEPLGAPWEGAVEDPQPVLHGAEPALHVAPDPAPEPHPPGSQALGGPGVPLPPVGHEDHVPAVLPHELLHEAAGDEPVSGLREVHLEHHAPLGVEGHPEPDPLSAHPNLGLVEDDVACALQRPLEVAPRGAVGAVHPPANGLVAALEAPLVEEVLPYIAEAQLEPKIGVTQLMVVLWGWLCPWLQKRLKQEKKQNPSGSATTHTRTHPTAQAPTRPTA